MIGCDQKLLVRGAVEEDVARRHRPRRPVVRHHEPARMRQINLRHVRHVDDVQQPLAGGRDLDGELPRRVPLGIDVSASNLSWIRAAGGMVSITADFARFAEAVLTGALLSSASFAEILTFVPTANPRKGEGIGVYRIGTANGELVGMDGQGPRDSQRPVC